MGYFGSFAWAGAAVKRLAEFAEKSKFELIGDPVEMKQAMKDLTYTPVSYTHLDVYKRQV